MSRKGGQSEVKVNGKSYRLPTEDAKVERLVRRAFEAKVKADTAAEEFKGLKKELEAIASARRGKSNTVRLGWIDLCAVMRFGQSVSFEAQRLGRVREILGSGKFDELFSERLSFTARKPLELFLKESGNVEAKSAISLAMTVTDSAAKLTFETLKDSGNPS